MYRYDKPFYMKTKHRKKPAWLLIIMWVQSESVIFV